MILAYVQSLALYILSVCCESGTLRSTSVISYHRFRSVCFQVFHILNLAFFFLQVIVHAQELKECIKLYRSMNPLYLLKIDPSVR
jgi:hypothetical protein